MNHQLVWQYYNNVPRYLMAPQNPNMNLPYNYYPYQLYHNHQPYNNFVPMMLVAKPQFSSVNLFAKNQKGTYNFPQTNLNSNIENPAILISPKIKSRDFPVEIMKPIEAKPKINLISVVKNPVLPFLNHQDYVDNRINLLRIPISFVNSTAFCLENDARKLLNEDNELSKTQKKTILSFFQQKIRKLSKEEKGICLQRYLDKKHRRNVSHKIKYEVRQSIANERLRIKGKFAKSAKIDMKHAAEILREKGIDLKF